jgi:hypothetical protein
MQALIKLSVFNDTLMQVGHERAIAREMPGKYEARTMSLALNWNDD